MASKSDSSPHTPTTEEHKPPTGQHRDNTVPMLLLAFPIQKAFPLPPLQTPIGRDWFKAYGFEDTKISGTHLRLAQRGSTLYVEDIGSSNGTFVEGERIAPRTPVELAEGDVLRMGGSIFVLRMRTPGQVQPRSPLGDLVGPWGLDELHIQCAALQNHKDLNILIEGETGTGKELLAAYLAHRLRPGKPYSPINITAFPKEMLDAGLYGAKRGAFTGSIQDNPGFVRAHKGGSILFDEIGEMPLELQPKLLRLLQNRDVMPIGVDRPEIVDVLILAATNRSLEDLSSAGTFRRDLLARFPVRLTIPPLRERPEDIFAILQALWKRLRPGEPALSPSHMRVDVEAIERLMVGELLENVRQLERVIHQVPQHDLSGHGLKLSLAEHITGQRARPFKLTVETVNKALADTGNNQSDAARKLGISRGKLRRFIDSQSKR